MFLEAIKKHWPQYVLELVVIILGITLSFLLNEWRSESNRAEAETKALESMRKDLVADTLLLNEAVAQIDKQDSSLSYMIKLYGNRARAASDSILNAMAAYVSYYKYNENNTTYEQLKQTGQLNLIRNEHVLKAAIDLYTDKADLIHEYVQADRKMILDHFIPFLMDEDAMFFTDDPMKKEQDGSFTYQKLINQKYFRNSLIVNRVFKRQLKQHFKEYKKSAAELIKRIDAELARLR